MVKEYFKSSPATKMKLLLIALGIIFTSCKERDQEVTSGDLHDSEISERTASEASEEVTFFKDRNNLAVAIAHQIIGNKLVVTASVLNKSDENITFVDHPDFWSIAIYAVDRNKDEAINAGQFFHYHRASQENLEIVKPQASARFERSYIMRRKPRGVIEVEEYPQFSEPKSYVRITDSDLQVRFHYGVYPKRLPEEAGSLSRNYVMVEVGATKRFVAPDVLPEANDEQGPGD